MKGAEEDMIAMVVGIITRGKCILKENKVKMVSGDQGSASIL